MPWFHVQLLRATRCSDCTWNHAFWSMQMLLWGAVGKRCHHTVVIS